jgi:hypothetical protein
VTTEGRKSLQLLLKANKRLNTAYILRESFDQLWDYKSEAWAVFLVRQQDVLLPLDEFALRPRDASVFGLADFIEGFAEMAKDRYSPILSTPARRRSSSSLRIKYRATSVGLAP